MINDKVDLKSCGEKFVKIHVYQIVDREIIVEVPVAFLFAFSIILQERGSVDSVVDNSFARIVRVRSGP